jgi:hypothetical protein
MISSTCLQSGELTFEAKFTFLGIDGVVDRYFFLIASSLSMLFHDFSYYFHKCEQVSCSTDPDLGLPWELKIKKYWSSKLYM